MKFAKTTAKYLKLKCDKYIQEQKCPTPRHFRSFCLFCTKQDIQYLKEKKPTLYKVIKDAEDQIMAKIEQKIVWNTENKEPMAGLIFILRSYDPDQYAQDIKKYEDLIKRPPINLTVSNKSGNSIIGKDKKNE